MSHTLATRKQTRLDMLMEKNNQGEMTDSEREELKDLVREAEELMLANARFLQQQRLTTT